MRALVALLLAVLIGSCRDEEKPVRPEVRADSMENRRQLAEELVKVYPNDEFVRDLSERIVRVTGKQVFDEARAKVREKLPADKWTEQRIDLYIGTFTVAELALLIELHRSSTGASLLRKLPGHDDAWRDFLTPVLIEALSNKEEGSR